MGKKGKKGGPKEPQPSQGSSSASEPTQSGPRTPSEALTAQPGPPPKTPAAQTAQPSHGAKTPAAPSKPPSPKNQPQSEMPATPTSTVSQQPQQSGDKPPVQQDPQLPQKKKTDKPPVPQQQPQQSGGKPPTQQNPQLPQKKETDKPPGPQQQPQPSGGKPPTQQNPQLPPKKEMVPQQQQQPQQASAQGSEAGTGAKKNKKKKGKGTTTPAAAQPSDTGPAPAEPSSSGKQISQDASKAAGETLTDDMKKLSLAKAPYKCRTTIPPRITKRAHSQNTCLKKIKIEVNYLPITISNPNLKIYHYDVEFKPDKPKSLFRRALAIMLQNNCPKRHPAFDGKKNLYAAGSLLFRGDMIRDSVEVTDPEDANRVKTFDITIKLTPQELNMSQLKEYSEKGRSQNIPQDVIQAMDIALRSGLYEHFIPCARSFFSGPANVNLGGGMELYNGFFQSAIVGTKKIFLNVDVANKAFPIEQSVLRYLVEVVGVPERDLSHPQGLEDYAKRALQTYIKGLKIAYRINEGERRTYRVNGIAFSARKHMFEHEGREISVADYFKNVKRKTLRYPDLPLLHVGPPLKNTMVPLEFCTIIGNQVIMRKLDDKQTSNMVKAAATSTDVRKRRIFENINNAGYNRSEVLGRGEFGITVGDRFTEVDSWVFKPPSIQYKENSIVPNNGEWRMDRLSFLNTQQGIHSWAILIKDGRTREDEIRNGLVRQFITCGRQMGLNVADPKKITTSGGQRDQSEAAILNDLVSLNKNYGPLQIVVVVMSTAQNVYSNIKRASELNCGVLTQCLKSLTATKKMNNATAQNILLKMNAKINGVNHALTGPLKPAVFKTPVMFVGADVTHPAPGSENNPSIAAVAASFDPSGFKYKMMYYLQGSRREMIEGLEEIMVEQLKHFQKMNRILPHRILYYRDGVSEGQFSQVLDIELDALKKACRNKAFENYNPLITFLVVQKRHHTRFFPKQMDGDKSKNNNVLAGTVVDTDITHPTELDFYLVSHKSIQGTARPTKYHVLYDENQFESEDLEMLTYYLCYLFSRCNRSVSYPAPTYYAHLGAFRARAYWDGQRIDLTELRREQAQRGTIKEQICEGTPMFFV